MVRNRAVNCFRNYKVSSFSPFWPKYTVFLFFKGIVVVPCNKAQSWEHWLQATVWKWLLETPKDKG